LTWTRQHTFYTHFLANEVFARANEEVEVKDINYAKTKVLKLFEVNYSNILSNLSNGQKALITAIGKEGEVSELYNREFLSKYKLAASSVTQALQKMLEKDLIKVSMAPSKQNYFIQDVFLVDI
jgi:uncharacterized protein